MIYKFVEYLTLLPTPTTAPLRAAFNTADMLAAMGGVSEVKVYDTRPSPQTGLAVAPYVRLWDAGIVLEQQNCLGGSSYVKSVMMVEAVADGTTPAEAEGRAYYLVRAVRSKLNLIKVSGVPVLLTTDLSVSVNSAVDSLQNWTVKDVGHPVTAGKDSKFQTHLSLQVVCNIFRGA